MSNGETPAVPGAEGNEDASPNRFGPQCFLLDFFKQFVRRNTGQSYGSYVKLNGNPSIAINRILDKQNSFPLNEMTPAQQAMLVPKFKLYKVQKNGSCSEFFFDDYTTLDSITDSTLASSGRTFLDPRGRPVAAGFKSFQWEDLGSNPANQGVSFKATLQLVFANMDSLFRVQPSGLSFADLVVPTGTKKTKKNPKMDPKEHRIKVDVGWHVPNMNDEGLWGDSASQKIYKRAIRASSVVLLLNLTTHELDIKEDGSLGLTLEYVAAVEGGLMSAAADLFYLGDKDPGEATATSVKRKQEELKKLKGQVKALEDAGHTSYALWDDQELDDAENLVDDKQTEIDNLEKDAAGKKEVLLLEAYNKLMRSITEIGRFYRIDLGEKDLKVYTALNKLYQMRDTNGKPLSEGQIAVRRRTIIAGYRVNEGNGGNPTRGLPEGSFDIAKEINDEITAYQPEPGDKAAIVMDTRAENVQDVAEAAGKLVGKAKLVETTRINWFFLGDLLQAAFETVVKNQLAAGEKKSIWRYMVGTVSMYDPDSHNFIEVNIADFPICWEYFQSFWLKKVIKPMREKYNIRDFINDVIGELLIGSLSPTCFGQMQAQIKTRVNSQTLSLPSSGHCDPIPPGGRVYGNASEIGAIMKNRWGKPVKCGEKPDNPYRQYWYVYGSGFSSANLKGNRGQDESRGIIHLPIGSQAGLLKTVKFSRQDMPGQREANISKAAEGGTVSNLMFSDRYNANLSLFGNLLFKNGIMVYLDTSGLGIGKPSHVGSAAAKMGIGGYYRVIKVSNQLESGKFETTLETKLESLGDKEPRKSTRVTNANDIPITPEDVARTRGRGASSFYKNLLPLNDISNSPEGKC